MDTVEMLSRLKSKDYEAYQQLTEKYGQTLYSYIQGRLDDRKKIHAVFQETLSDFCSIIADPADKDVVEYLLLTFAEKNCDKTEPAKEVPAASPPAVRAAEEEMQESEVLPSSEIFAHKEEKKTSGPGSGSGKLGFRVAASLLILGIAAALWVILGLLMDMELIPQINLGYEWFNLHVAPWF